MKVAFLLLTLLWLPIGCGKSEEKPAAPSPASQPATKPGPAVLNVGGEPIEFAVTHLDITREPSSMHLLLYGSDRADKPQSSFYFDITLDGDDPETLPGKVWRFAPSAEEDISGSLGIFLNGDAIRMQPKVVTVEFGGDYPVVNATLTGTFLRDGDEAKPVKVSGTFTVIGTEKPSK
jgi:hypothetical protein